MHCYHQDPLPNNSLPPAAPCPKPLLNNPQLAPTGFLSAGHVSGRHTKPIAVYANGSAAHNPGVTFMALYQHCIMRSSAINAQKVLSKHFFLLVINEVSHFPQPSLYFLVMDSAVPTL